jgi:prepilin-type N-terminal cleavage/methylation domain-containing protein
VKSRSGKKGFTLVEILVAVAIIAAIVSMVYGSYFATSKSAQACRTRIALSQQGRDLLAQMVRQIRCCYVGSVKVDNYTDRKVSQQIETRPENITGYFLGNSGETGGEILHLVTTSSMSDGEAAKDGLFEVIYKFDNNNNTLFLSNERLLGTPQNVAEIRSWHLLAENITGIELAFSDGRQWLQNWDFREKGKLPLAVKIDITCEDENHRQYHDDTIAYIFCRKNQNQTTVSETSEAKNKQ